MSKIFRSNGKLLLTGEYVVLDGAVALALPTKQGQSLEVSPAEGGSIIWTALDHQGDLWFKTHLRLLNGEIVAEDKEQNSMAERLSQILTQAHSLNQTIFGTGNGYIITTKLEFPNDWGLGSSSTLVNNIAQWFNIDPYKLLYKTFGGSGYDIAAAMAENPITYQLQENSRSIFKVNFDPPFKDHLFFVYLNRKQNSRSSIAHYKKQPKEKLQNAVDKISALTNSFLNCDSITEFNLLLGIHETIISQIINTPKIKTKLFPDYTGSIKSLGGWGGDFILATGGEKEQNYFLKKGYEVVIPYSEMLL